MSKLPLIASLLVLLASVSSAQTKPKPEDTEFYTPVPKVVTPGRTDADPPSDAIVLFDGRNLDQWVTAKDGAPAYVTAFHNGVLVQNHVELHGVTLYIGKPFYRAHGPAPILLQAHGDPSPAISFRNIWVRELP